MKSATAVRTLTLLALAAPLLALWPQDPEPGAVDWASHVEKACSSPRYGLRLAAARKVAEAGDAAVPAIRAREAARGRNDLPVALIDSIADADAGGTAVFDLLRDWALDRDFYWRAQALRGLARRGAATSGERRDELQRVFAVLRDDPAWLTRTHARYGAVLLGVDAAAVLPETDPRARVRLTALLLGAGRTPPLQPLFDALPDQRTFLGDPWGARRAAEAHKALKTWLGDAYPLPDGGEGGDRQQAIAALRDAAQQCSGQTIAMPEPLPDAATGVTGGIEILSCKAGDRFVQWSDDGAVWSGIDAGRRVQLEPAAWQPLLRDRTRLALAENLGVVICDNLRVRLFDPDVHVKVAPASLPAPAADWLKQLAQRLEEGGAPDLATELRRGLEQFAGP